MNSPAHFTFTPLAGRSPIVRFAFALASLFMGVPMVASAQFLVSAGGDTTCAVVSGAAYCWGYNASGQVGNNSTANAPSPVSVQGLTSGVTAIATSGSHSCAVVNGAARCWGNNAYGQLGNNGSSNSPVPVAVSGLASGVTAISVGDLHTCAVANGGVQCWGSGGYGQLGTGASIFSSAVPVPVAGLGSGATAVSTGRFQSCAVVSGATYCWGRGESGELGNGLSSATSVAPVAVSGFASGSADVSGGGYFTCGIRNAGAYCWGFGGSGQIGNSASGNVSTPQAVIGLASGVTAISAGSGLHGCAIANGAAQCWGSNNGGQLGNPAAAGGSNTPVGVQGLASGMLRISAGGLHTCAIGAAGLYCWGTNTYGQLGTGNQNPSPTPLLIIPTPPAPTNPPRLVNISTRMQVLAGNDVMIGGFVIGGSTPKTVVVRARGPSLIPYGITNALADPTLGLYSGSTLLASSDDWQDAPNAATLQASGFAPGNPLESAIYTTLSPGAYTAIVAGFQNGTGVGIVEVFEVDHPEIPLINISTRGRVLTGNDVMIGGFVIQGDAPQTVVVRARGPSLIPYGIADALANPVLQLVRASDGVTIAINDDWGSAGNSAQLNASGFAPSNAFESAILITLQPGAYTAIVTGVGGGTGVGIVEVFAQ